MSYLYLIIFFGLMANGAGIPVPGEIYLLLGGAMSASGKLDFVTAMPVAAAGAVIGDCLAFYIGRFGGRRLINFYCNYTLCTVKCSDRITSFYKRFGIGALPLTRYIPGIRLLMAPMAGASRITFMRFFILNGIGALSWIATYLLIGYVLQNAIFDVIEIVENVRYGGIIILMSIFSFILFKILKRMVAAKRDLRDIKIEEKPLN